MRPEIFSSDGQIVATMTFNVSSIVAKTLAEPVIGSRYRRLYAASQCLRWTNDRPAMYPPTPVHHKSGRLVQIPLILLITYRKQTTRSIYELLWVVKQVSYNLVLLYWFMHGLRDEHDRLPTYWSPNNTRSALTNTGYASVFATMDDTLKLMSL